jgi:hypothetical protein
MTIESIALWHNRARPAPTEKDLNVQLGCHFEEIIEMLETLRFSHTTGNGIEMPGKNSDIYQMVQGYADGLKSGRIVATIANRRDFLDSMADQVVTAVGVGHCADMDISKAVEIVNTSNWSKFDRNGNPFFDQNGKILKGPNYHAPDLEGLY